MLLCGKVSYHHDNWERKCATLRIYLHTDTPPDAPRAHVQYHVMLDQSNPIEHGSEIKAQYRYAIYDYSSERIELSKSRDSLQAQQPAECNPRVRLPRILATCIILGAQPMQPIDLSICSTLLQVCVGMLGFAPRMRSPVNISTVSQWVTPRALNKADQRPCGKHPRRMTISLP